MTKTKRCRRKSKHHFYGGYQVEKREVTPASSVELSLLLRRALHSNSNPVICYKIDLSHITDLNRFLPRITSEAENEKFGIVSGISSWEVGHVTKMTEFDVSEKSHFNLPLNWDTSNVTDMTRMFYCCAHFNQPLNWNTSNVKTTVQMFENCTAFDGETLSTWDMSNLVDAGRMFVGCTNFNQRLNWDVRKVRSVREMFLGCTNFNQRLDWDVRKVANMEEMFSGCTNLRQDFSGWNINVLANTEKMFTSNIIKQPTLFIGLQNNNVITYENRIVTVDEFNNMLPPPNYIFIVWKINLHFHVSLFKNPNIILNFINQLVVSRSQNYIQIRTIVPNGPNGVIQMAHLRNAFRNINCKKFFLCFDTNPNYYGNHRRFKLLPVDHATTPIVNQDVINVNIEDEDENDLVYHDANNGHDEDGDDNMVFYDSKTSDGGAKGRKTKKARRKLFFRG